MWGENKVDVVSWKMQREFVEVKGRGVLKFLVG